MSAPVYSREPIVVDIACKAGDVINLYGTGPCRVLSAHSMDDWQTLVTVQPALSYAVEDDEPWTFGDLEPGDWFVVPGSKNARQKATAHHSTLDDGSGFMDHMAADPVEPFEWEWSE